MTAEEMSALIGQARGMGGLAILTGTTWNEVGEGVPQREREVNHSEKGGTLGWKAGSVPRG